MKTFLIVLTCLWILFWQIAWIYDQTRMGKRDGKNIIFAICGWIAIVLLLKN
tara:strand:+ start:1434 stop:1589 length:156 start_codon:yes stop_codon:yes gene_type:complete